MTDFFRDNRGQSFIEAMVALTIIITSVSSALALIQSSITATRIGGAQVLAANLTREGLEVARAIRDSDWLSGNPFTLGLTDASFKTARPTIDPATGGWTMRFGAYDLADETSRLYLGTQGLYLHADAAPPGDGPTPYRRLLTINHICRSTATGAERIETGASATCNAAETLIGLDVISSVRYRTVSGAERTVSAEERLYDWR